LNKLTEKKSIIWRWVKAHAGNKFNELADKLAAEAIIN
jgi:ribonuclease HI